MIVQCEYCKKDYTTPECWYKRSKHHCCSKECSNKLKIQLHIKNCKQCNKPFHKKYHQKISIYCSVNCQKEASKKRITLYCNICGIKYIVNKYREGISKFCSRKCLTVHTGYLASQRVGELNKNYKGYKDEKRTNKGRLRTWATAVKQRDKVCVLCKSDKKLSAHHIKPYAQYKDLRFDLDNGMLLCQYCHSLQHINDKVSVKQLILN